MPQRTQGNANSTTQRQHDTRKSREQQAAARRAAAAESAARVRWGTRDDALERLSHLGQALVRLRLEEDALVSERDELIAHLRDNGVSWNQLASRTGLSRQALGKRRAVPSAENVAGTA